MVESNSFCCWAYKVFITRIWINHFVEALNTKKFYDFTFETDLQAGTNSWNISLSKRVFRYFIAFFFEIYLKKEQLIGNQKKS